MKCALSQKSKENCFCENDSSCLNPSDLIEYPCGRILGPYVFNWYNRTRNWFERIPYFLTIKYREYEINALMWKPYSSLFRSETFESSLK